MKIVITGGTGLLGKALIEKCESDHEILATYFGDYEMESTGRVRYLKLDIQDHEGYYNLFKDFSPDVVVHTASIGSPDFAEKNKDKTWNINVKSTKNIISICEKIDSKFIFISSNGIYDGNNAPYCEQDRVVPINYYGQIKLEGENITKKAKIPYAIVRPILMYGWPHPFERSNIITIALSKFKKREKIYVYNDVFINPLLSLSCAEAIWKIIESNKYDIFNIAGADTVSIYELVKRTTVIFGFDQNLAVPVQQGFFNELVKRPVNTSFSTEKMEKVLGIMPVSVDDGLTIMERDKQ